jgi:hypothetical protein
MTRGTRSLPAGQLEPRPGGAAPGPDGSLVTVTSMRVQGPGPRPGGRPRELSREAYRSVTSGTTQALLWAVLLAALLGLLGWMDAKVVADLVDESLAYAEGGGSTWVLEAPGRIDGTLCDRLDEATGVEASGALRSSQTRLRLVALSSAPLPRYDVTPGFAALMGAPAATGVLLPERVAASLGLVDGDPLATASGLVPLGGVFAYPEDGRRTGLGYAALTPVPASGTLDECWIRVWPVDTQAISLVRIALVPSSAGDTNSPQLSQLNSTLAAGFEGHTRFQQRLTRLAPLVAFVAGLVVGGASLIGRRLPHRAAPRTGVGTSLRHRPGSVDLAGRARGGTLDSGWGSLGLPGHPRDRVRGRHCPHPYGRPRSSIRCRRSLWCPHRGALDVGRGPRAAPVRPVQEPVTWLAEPRSLRRPHAPLARSGERNDTCVRHATYSPPGVYARVFPIVLRRGGR